MSTEIRKYAMKGILADERPITKKRVAFRDCDAFGLLDNTRFLDYVLDIRYDHLIEYYDIDFLKHRYEDGGMFVIVAHQASYLHPVRAHEEILISTNTIFADAESIIVEGAMTSLDGKKMKYHQWTRLRVFDPLLGTAAPITPAELSDIRRTIEGGTVADVHD